MTYDPQSHPLHGKGLEAVLSEVLRHYGWPILAEQIPIKCFQSYPTFESAAKFLKKTVWARERLEAFYLYKFKQCARPSDEQHRLQPRNRDIDGAMAAATPAEIELGDPEFFDDPASGPVFPSRKAVQETRSKKARGSADVDDPSVEAAVDVSPTIVDEPPAVVDEPLEDDQPIAKVQKKEDKISTKKVTPKRTAAAKPDSPANSSSGSGSSDPWAKWRK